MRREIKIVLFILALLMLAIAAIVFVRHAEAETLPTQNVTLTGDFRLSDAPQELYVAKCLRVDLVSAGSDGPWADLTLPYIPPNISDVLLFDGWHVIRAWWEQIDENTLCIRFEPWDVAKLDGTVGVYLVILANNEGA